MLTDLARACSAKMAARIGYDGGLAHRMEAGADLFLMRSRYEACGLNQIYSLRYGTIPVVRATGGLDDTIEQFDPGTGQGTGFKFHIYSAEALLAALREALLVYQDTAAWRKMQRNAMAKDFSWDASATEYIRLYETAREARIRTAAPSSNISV